MDTKGETNLFAEFRPNINIVAITISLATSPSLSTRTRLTDTHSRFVLEHGNREFVISLPANVYPPSESGQYLSGSFACELRLAARELARFKQSPGDQTYVPWSAPSLGQDTELTCNTCKALIVGRGKVKTWKDLPSEGWAEMMDLWHCHKPHEHDHAGNESTDHKGYSASSKLIAKRNTGFVDVMSFLLAQEDCNDVQIRMAKNDTDAPSVLCISCNAVIGFKDDQAEGLRLHKMSFALSRSPTVPSHSFESAKWLACHLLSAIETQGVRKFVFSNLPYEIWIFSSDVCYSSLAEPEPIRGIKVYYRKTNKAKDVELLKSQNLHIETLTLPMRLEEFLLSTLQKSNESLPEKTAVFLDWRVGLLPKFSKDDLDD